MSILDIITLPDGSPEFSSDEISDSLDVSDDVDNNDALPSLESIL